VKIGIIGFGRLGALLTRHFAREHEIKVFDTRRIARAIRRLGAEPVSLAQVCQQEIIVPCVPIADFEPLLRRIRGLLRADALLIDVCSVKEHPVRVMKRLLPRSIEILATHPNFGPDSAAESLSGRQIAVCKVRISAARYALIRRAFERKGLQLVEMSAREHDRRMASSLLLTHFIGRGLIEYGAKPTGIDTEGYKRLLRILETVQNDSEQLFLDMNRYNAFAPAMRRRLLAALRRVDKRVRS